MVIKKIKSYGFVYTWPPNWSLHLNWLTPWESILIRKYWQKYYNFVVPKQRLLFSLIIIDSHHNHFLNFVLKLFKFYNVNLLELDVSRSMLELFSVRTPINCIFNYMHEHIYLMSYYMRQSLHWFKFIWSGMNFVRVFFRFLLQICKGFMMKLPYSIYVCL